MSGHVCIARMTVRRPFAIAKNFGSIVAIGRTSTLPCQMLLCEQNMTIRKSVLKNNKAAVQLCLNLTFKGMSH